MSSALDSLALTLIVTGDWRLQTSSSALRYLAHPHNTSQALVRALAAVIGHSGQCWFCRRRVYAVEGFAWPK